ncbi:MAG TPA: hypothetical protein VHE55_01970 [Fimbriimonadaceae bacterium]|nr:hypothetical protein [Fimbriimonadaceae bacterium]
MKKWEVAGLVFATLLLWLLGLLIARGNAPRALSDWQQIALILTATTAFILGIGSRIALRLLVRPSLAGAGRSLLLLAVFGALLWIANGIVDRVLGAPSNTVFPPATAGALIGRVRRSAERAQAN